MEDKAKKLGYWSELIDVAKQDNKLTMEEVDLIDKILSDAEKYRNVLNQAFEDGEISEDQKELLMDTRKQLLDNAYEKASGDRKISEDELAILKKTLDILHQLELNEERYSTYWT